MATIVDSTSRHDIGGTLFYGFYGFILALSAYIVPRSIRSSIVLTDTEVVIRGTFRTRRVALRAIVMCDLESLTYAEIADLQRTTIGTVRSRIHRGRKMLREIIQKTGLTLLMR